MWTIIECYVWLFMAPAVVAVLAEPFVDLFRAFGDWSADRRWRKQMEVARDEQLTDRAWEERVRKLDAHLSTEYADSPSL